MKPRTKNKMLPVLAGLLLLPALLLAQGNGNGHNSEDHYPNGNGNGNGHNKHHNAPIDGGLSLLLAAGAAVGAKRAYRRKKAIAAT